MDLVHESDLIKLAGFAQFPAIGHHSIDFIADL